MLGHGSGWVCLFICLLGERKKCQVAKKIHTFYTQTQHPPPPHPPTPHPDIAAFKSTGKGILKMSQT